MVRIKRRYVVIKLIKKKGAIINGGDLMNEITNHVAQLYGDFGMGCLKRNFALKRFDHIDGYAIMQVRKGVHEMLMSVLPLITKIADKQVSLIIIHLSGTMRHSLKKLQNDYLMSLRAAIGQQTAESNKTRSIKSPD